LPEADIWTAGLPCQSYSVAGKRLGFEDERGNLIFEVFRLAAERKPRFILLENVKGLLNHGQGDTFQRFLQGFWELGYNVQWQLLNSKNWVPQNRERIFLVASVGGESIPEVFPITGANGSALVKIVDGAQGMRVYDPDGIGTCISSGSGGLGAKAGLYLIDQSSNRPKITEDARCITARYTAGISKANGVRSAVLEFDKGAEALVTPVLTPGRTEKRQNGRRFKEPGEESFCITAQDVHGVMIIDEQGRKNKDVTPKEECPTLRAEAHGNEPVIIDTRHPKQDKRIFAEGICPTLASSDHKDMKKVFQGAEIRRLTPRECFRLQGVPDEYFERASKVLSDSRLYKCIGNAVTVPVVYEIAKRLQM
jgi:DNA (cytosine-5)-methyltransferase 1